MTETKTPLDVKYLEDIDKSRRIIDQLNLLPDKFEVRNKDFDDIIYRHEDRIRFYLEKLNRFYKKLPDEQ